MSHLLRLLDANANRAREGLRVLEDYARFVLGDASLSSSLKSLRHDLAAALAPVSFDSIVHRDTPGDVGTTLKTRSEFARSDLAAVVLANAKRLEEALRSLEEYLKVDHPESAHAIERARYATYEIERKLALTLRPKHERLAQARLYVLITESACRRDWLDTARLALEGGADILQLREKELEGRELLTRAKRLVALCKEFNALCIINDRADIALLSNADGLHLGQGDLPATEARKLLGSSKLIGVSTHEPAHAKQALLDSADYIGAGPTFRSPTKPRDINPGLPYLESLRSFDRPPLPTFAIAGITLENLNQVLATGCNRIAVTAAVTGAEDVKEVCEGLKRRLNATV